MIYLTSDTHFGHTKIIEYCQRPFASIEEMDETLIENWNAVVCPDDSVYHLGDFCLGDAGVARKYMKRLNGRIGILAYPFHHDHSWLKRSFVAADGLNVGLVGQMITIDLPNYGPRHGIVLCHYPMFRWDRGHYGWWHAYGHIHSSPNKPMPTLGFAWDVGVDNNNFAPISLDTLAEKMYKMGWRPNMGFIGDTDAL